MEPVTAFTQAPCFLNWKRQKQLIHSLPPYCWDSSSDVPFQIHKGYFEMDVEKP